MSRIKTGREERVSWITGMLSILTVTGVFIIVCLSLIVIGLRIYKKVVLDNNNNYELRTSLDYVATKIRQTDTAGLTRIEKFDGTDILYLGEYIDGTEYDTLIYYYNGNICEQFMEKDADFDLSYGMPTFEVDGFNMTMDDGVIALTASNAAGESDSLSVYLRTY